MTNSTKTDDMNVAQNVHPIGGMGRDKLITRHTDACVAQMALEQAMTRLHRLGYSAEYQALAVVWGVVCEERTRVADRLFPKQPKGKR